MIFTLSFLSIVAAGKVEAKITKSDGVQTLVSLAKELSKSEKAAVKTAVGIKVVADEHKIASEIAFMKCLQGCQNEGTAEEKCQDLCQEAMSSDNSSELKDDPSDSLDDDEIAFMKCLQGCQKEGTAEEKCQDLCQEAMSSDNSSELKDDPSDSLDDDKPDKKATKADKKAAKAAKQLAVMITKSWGMLEKMDGCNVKGNKCNLKQIVKQIQSMMKRILTRFNKLDSFYQSKLSRDVKKLHAHVRDISFDDKAAKQLAVMITKSWGMLEKMDGCNVKGNKCNLKQIVKQIQSMMKRILTRFNKLDSFYQSKLSRDVKKLHAHVRDISFDDKRKLEDAEKKVLII